MPEITVSRRQQEIATEYLAALDQYIDRLKNGEETRVMEIRDFAALLHLHPVHLSNTVKEATGQSTCDLYESRLLRISKELLSETTLPIGTIAAQLLYDPSNFTKFFKAYTGMTPKAFRQSIVQNT